MRQPLLLILFIWIFTISVNAAGLENTAWSIVSVDCSVTAKDTSDQFFLDSLFQSLKKKVIAPADQYVYEFTSDELVRKKMKEKSVSHWKYKVQDQNLVVDFGKGMMLIQKYEITNDTLILELDKSLFLISEFSPKSDSVKALIDDISLKYYYKKK